MGRLRRTVRGYRARSVVLRTFAVTLVCVMLLSALIGSLYTNRLLGAIEDQVAEANLSALRRSADMIDSVMLQMRGLAYTLASDESSYSFVTLHEDSVFYASRAKAVERSLSLIVKAFDFLDSASVYSEVSDTVVEREGTRAPKLSLDGAWLARYERLEYGRVAVFFERRNNLYPYWITILCPIRGANRDIAGAVALHINIEALGNLIGDTLQGGQQMYIFDERGQLYYASDYRLLGAQDALPEHLSYLTEAKGEVSEQLSLEGGEYVVSSLASGVEQWRYAFLSQFAAYRQRVDMVNAFLLRMIVLIASLSLVLVFLLTRRLYRPLTSILHSIDAPEARYGDADSQNEVERIISSFDRARLENDRMKKELEARMKTLSAEQMRALQSQIDPHFLYNALDAMHWMSMQQQGGENEVSDMASTLAQLLRISLKCDNYLVALREEIEHVKMYMKIFEGRYHDKIRVRYDIPEDALNCRVLKLSIQPLIENAVKHGLRPRRYRGEIALSARVEAGALTLRVEDDGVGMEPEQMRRINESLRRCEEREGHVGLCNVNRRIQLIFGEEYGVTVEALAAGTAVTITLPASGITTMEEEA